MLSLAFSVCYAIMAGWIGWFFFCCFVEGGWVEWMNVNLDMKYNMNKVMPLSQIVCLLKNIVSTAVIISLNKKYKKYVYLFLTVSFFYFLILSFLFLLILFVEVCMSKLRTFPHVTISINLKHDFFFTLIDDMVFHWMEWDGFYGVKKIYYRKCRASVFVR